MHKINKLVNMGGGYPIKSKNDLREAMLADDRQFSENKPGFKDWILNNERWFIYHYKHELRIVEYYKNTRGHGIHQLFHKIAFLIHWYRYKHLSWKMHCTIYPNTIAPGLSIYHVGNFIHVGPENQIGWNCVLRSGVVFANANGLGQRRVGDNCVFGVDCKIIPAVNIGNNVEVGANAVVTKNIPDNAIVAGVPARVIKIRNGIV